VVVQSAEQRMRAPSLDLYFTRAAPAVTSGAKTANSAAGAQQISRAVGTGGVIVEQGGRKATAEHGEYIAASGKFVMSAEILRFTTVPRHNYWPSIDLLFSG